MDPESWIKEILYFSKPGIDNTAACVNTAVNRARELGITTFGIATTSGRSAFELYERIDPAT